MRGALSRCTCVRPGNLDEALALLAGEPGRWTPLAGGTDLMVGLASGALEPRAVLDLGACEALRGLRAEAEAFRIGALCTFRELIDAPELRRELPVLAQAARATGALAIQNRGTLGGNLAHASPAADAATALLACGAELELASVRGRRRLPLEAFFLGYRRTALAPDELITSIHVPRPAGRSVQLFRKVAPRAAQAIAKLSLAACAELEDGRLKALRLGLGAVAPVPLRARRTESLLAGRALGDLPRAEAREALMGELAPIDDLRSTARYRRRVAGNLLEAFLEGLAGL